MGHVDVLYVPRDAARERAVSVLRDAASVYGWRLEDAGDGAFTVVPDTCTRSPEALRVLERARQTMADAVAGVTAERRSPDAPPVRLD